MSALKCVSWNIHGMGSQAKRTKIFNHLAKLQVDICLLQETHLSESDYNKLNSSQSTHSFSAHYNKKTKRSACSTQTQKNIHFFHQSITRTHALTSC
uniref:Endonuclease/exonuclease/phosphatase domain-containing protein n=1 Tax=Labrus bergylta TaxID=56723 RepID=A0A3Q3FCA8_9LABR